MPAGRLPGLTISRRSEYTSTKTLAPSKNQSRCVTAFVIASRTAFLGYSEISSRLSPSIRWAVLVLRSTNRIAPWMSPTIPRP